MTRIVMRNELAVELTDDEYKLEFGTIVEPEPGPAPVPRIISDRQFYQELANEGVITRAAALAAVKTGTLPALFQAALDSMTDPALQFAADMLLSGATQFERDHPMVGVIGAILSKTDEDLDNVWIRASAL